MEAAVARASTAALSLRTAAAKRSGVGLCPPSRLPPTGSGGSGCGGGIRCQGGSVRLHKRDLCMAARAQLDGASGSPTKVAESFFRSVISKMENVYLGKNPTASAILDLVRSSDGDNVCYDHFAFRTFGVDGHGIDSMANFFVDFGYTPRDELRFPAKKLRALWFAPPETEKSKDGTGVQGPLPRIFISELIVDEMSHQSQEVIRKYTKLSGSGNNYAALASALGTLTWDRPLYSNYQLLLRESEYAAWTLVNGYALNHVTISAHRLKSHIRDINSLNQFIEDNGYKLNSEGGTLKGGAEAEGAQSKCGEEEPGIEPQRKIKIRLIIRKVWQKLIRNPNAYASCAGVAWALISFRYRIHLPLIVVKSITILSDGGLGMAMFSLGLFMASQTKVIACGLRTAILAMTARFLLGPGLMAVSSYATGLRGKFLKVAIVQAALPQGIVPFVFAKEYDTHPEILSTGLTIGMLIAMPIALAYFLLLGL